MRAKNIYLNGVPANIGPCPNEWLGSVDLILHGTSKSLEDPSYGGGFLLKDILEGKDIDVKVEAINGDIIESRFAVERRNRTIHARMREYLYELKHNEELITSIIPLGDGVTVSIKK